MGVVASWNRILNDPSCAKSSILSTLSLKQLHKMYDARYGRNMISLHKP